MTAAFAGLASALLALAALSLYLPVARRRNWVDSPNARSAHGAPVPNSGGIAVVPSVVATLLGLQAYLAAAKGPLIPALALLVVASLLICGLGAWDDRRDLPAGFRLGCFFALAAAVAFVWLPPGSPGEVLETVLLTVALAWLFNLYNFMDGLDGIAALQGVAVAGGVALSAQLSGAPVAYTGTALAVGGAYLAFLGLNWPPARLFMGDAGSLAAGLLLGWLGLWGWKGGYLQPEVWLLLMSPFLVDTAWTLVVRILRRERLAQAHRDHLYQRLARRWGSHGRVNLALLGLHLLWLQPLALGATWYPGNAMTFIALGLFPQLFLMVRFRRLQ